MRINMVRVLTGIILCSISSCDRFVEEDYQLVIINASLFNTNTLEIEENKSIFIQNGRIEKISETNTSDIALNNVLDAQQKLLTPSFIDVHNHLNFIFGDTVETINPENFQYSRELLTEQYMPFGVTVVRSAGGREQHIPMEQSWMKHHPGYVDYYPAGGALVSLDTKFYNHQYVKDSSDVVSKIEEYYNMGIRHIKIYSLIEEQELRAAIQKTTELNMNVFGHIENSMISIESACENGLVNFEHAKTLFLEVIRKYENTSKDLSKLPPDNDQHWRYREYEIFNLIETNDPLLLSLVEFLKEHDVSITPTLHIYAQPIGLVKDENQINLHKEDELNWSEAKFIRAKKGYKVLAALVYKLYKIGIILNTGSDTYEPGKTILSEMLLLNETGIPMKEVIKIATLNSARSTNLDKSYGSIEVGKKAHLILFDENPLINPLNLLSKKTIIKDGIVWIKP